MVLLVKRIIISICHICTIYVQGDDLKGKH